MPAKSPKARVERSCPKCGTAMAKGYVTRPWTQQVQQVDVWLRGSPPAPWLLGAKSTAANVLAVTSWRCTGCGYLESYAN